MKKLMVILVAAAMAMATQAATFSWKTTSTGKLYGAGSTTLLASGTAYLFDSTTVSQQALLTAVLAGTVQYRQLYLHDGPFPRTLG